MGGSLGGYMQALGSFAECVCVEALVDGSSWKLSLPPPPTTTVQVSM